MSSLATYYLRCPSQVPSHLWLLVQIYHTTDNEVAFLVWMFHIPWLNFWDIEWIMEALFTGEVSITKLETFSIDVKAATNWIKS